MKYNNSEKYNVDIQNQNGGQGKVIADLDLRKYIAEHYINAIELESLAKNSSNLKYVKSLVDELNVLQRYLKPHVKEYIKKEERNMAPYINELKLKTNNINGKVIIVNINEIKYYFDKLQNLAYQVGFIKVNNLYNKKSKTVIDFLEDCFTSSYPKAFDEAFETFDNNMEVLKSKNKENKKF
ncbi:hypothetical protein M2325_000672 [Methanococcus voltae PS]|uniref:Uncharacterized protein n=1 Tax=Methanococcus voltae PS TaxID=523842 RepID=A0ABT2EVM9_METVO|nr:hypothetical protein [Methanococcus voltae]MCS3921987.1 hypothetical protein [Methanococcus voltae PS]